MNNKQLQQVKKLVITAGKLANKHFSTLHKKEIFQKSKYERVTTIDRAINVFLEKKLPRIFDAPILSEEHAHHVKTATYWVVDPLDGTTNYITHIPFFCIGVGLVINGEIVLNIVYNPILKELFWATLGKGAFLNGRRIKHDSFTRLAKSVVGMTYAHGLSSIQHAGRIGIALRKHVHNTRHTGSTILNIAYVACGRLEAAIIAGPITPWDVIPALLLIREIRGTMTDFTGKPFHLGKSKNLILSNATEHAKIVSLVSKVR